MVPSGDADKATVVGGIGQWSVVQFYVSCQRTTQFMSFEQVKIYV